MMKKRFIPILLIFFLLLSAHPSFAQTCTVPGGGTGIDSAIGCINVTDFSSFAGWLLSWGIGIAGGISLLLILYSTFLITTSSGDPKKLQAGQEQLTSAVTGLLLVIFSIFILKVVGVDIFKIPGFG